MLCIRWGHGWMAKELHPKGGAPSARPSSLDGPDYFWRLSRLRDIEQARSAIVTWTGLQPYQLRQMLAPAEHLGLRHLTDAQVMDQVARRLVERDLLLYEKVLTPEAMARRAQQSAQAMSTEDAPLPASAAPRPRVWAMQAPPSPEPAQKAAEPDFLNQEAQARTLKVAAAHGIPFCEECEKRARANAEAEDEGEEEELAA